MSASARPAADGAPGYTETMPCEPESALRARLLVSAALNAWGIAELADVGMLVVSELVNNAVTHTRCRVVRVVVRQEPGGLVRIGVADKCRAVPEMALPDDDSEGGRGLVLVDAVCWRWGYERRSWGKLVWAQLRASGSC
ncbi:MULTISPECIES: ATP-binding protein [unclassified Streptomyces]|uniref:ATP-binding protein n=1 Tax=unclassified Streptomyces TaxID=2593676 RepID=UPI0038102DB1